MTVISNNETPLVLALLQDDCSFVPLSPCKVCIWPYFFSWKRNRGHYLFIYQRRILFSSGSSLKDESPNNLGNINEYSFRVWKMCNSLSVSTV